MEGAIYYNLYWDDFYAEGCYVSQSGKPVWCESLALRVTETTFVHTTPNDENYYWVTACNSDGFCSRTDSKNRAIEVLPIVPNTTPKNQRFEWRGGALVVSWDPVEGADHYNIYYDDFYDNDCYFYHFGKPSGRGPRWCEYLAQRVTETIFVHTTPEDQNYYWVVACNSDGFCSRPDSKNPARLRQ